LFADIAAELYEETVAHAERRDTHQLERRWIVERDFRAEAAFVMGAAAKIERAPLRAHDVVIDLEVDAAEERTPRLCVAQEQKLVERGDDVADAIAPFAAAQRVDDRVRLRARDDVGL